MPRVPPTITLYPHPHVLDWDQFLLIGNMHFGGQDYRLKQPEKALAYAKALQYWAEKAQPACPSKPCWLAEGMWELHQTMEPLVTFTDVEVLGYDWPSNWQRITPSRLMESEQPDQENWREISHNRSCQAHAMGAFTTDHGGGGPTVSTTAHIVTPEVAPTVEMGTEPRDTIIWQPLPPPGFADIAWSLWKDNPCQVVVGIPLELDED